ncbi:unnamed protein product [Nezara viridula]|uniref:Uncharacterized protein n=1 Tax=Nezara viridula TaxID=85310 RepID=A0A9P0MPD0_NEZVI|nr:unnamed protein product [Nezara viridula]
MEGNRSQWRRPVDWWIRLQDTLTLTVPVLKKKKKQKIIIRPLGPDRTLTKDIKGNHLRTIIANMCASFKTPPTELPPLSARSKLQDNRRTRLASQHWTPYCFRIELCRASVNTMARSATIS